MSLFVKPPSENHVPSLIFHYGYDVMLSLLVKTWIDLSPTSKLKISSFTDKRYACSLCLRRCTAAVSVEQLTPWDILENEE